ncbi:anaphase-promoting complex subunit 13 [Anaeramoeba ignava]|uniref:Anaphase-promoting complex subunit 13 n=1 Tax=Anaeramoeba ignava TaxID=1746090 RepID=A0A9Q0LGF3_ANAIG|nr:anaphase-promoting complex subunit 13 [Anaeramoeba ignava]
MDRDSRFNNIHHRNNFLTNIITEEWKKSSLPNEELIDSLPLPEETLNPEFEFVDLSIDLFEQEDENKWGDLSLQNFLDKK